MASKREKETQAAIQNVGAAIAANFDNKTVANFTDEQMHAGLAAVNKPLIALLLGIAPNRKGELKAARSNPRANGAQALALSARYGIVTRLATELRNQNVQTVTNNQQGAANNQGGMPADPNMAKPIAEVNGKPQFAINESDGKAGLEKFYGSLDFSHIILTPELINQLYEMGETILVTNPNKKAKKIWMWVGIGTAAAIGGYFIYKLVSSSEERKNGLVAVEKTDIDVDETPYVEVEEVEIGTPTHEETASTNAFGSSL